MNRPFRTWRFLAAALACLALPPMLLRAGEGEKPATKEDRFTKEVRPLIARYCISCHGRKNPKAKLNLESLPDQKSARTWQIVWTRLKSRQMPPANRPQPSDTERGRLISWIEETFATLDGHPDPGALRPRRLNVREHRNLFRDLAVEKDYTRLRRASYKPKLNGTISLYDSVVPPPEHPCSFVERILPPDTSDGGFDTITDNLSIPPFLLEKYLRCSKLLLDDLLSVNAGRGESYQWPLYYNVMKVQKGPRPKGQTSRQALVAFLQEFASRAFRRPVTADEVEKYARLFDEAQKKGEDFKSSIRLPLQAILVSPRFVILWSESKADSKKDTAPVRALDDLELATRLSFFLWSTLPNGELFQAARKGRLSDPKVLEQQVLEMLKDRRVTTGLVEGFLCQWLQLSRLDRTAPDAGKHPRYFKDNLGELMKQELLLFCDAILVEDRSILEFIDSDWGFLCYPLAQHYGIDKFPGKKVPSNAQPPWYRMKFPNKKRGGVLTMGKVLTGASQPTRTSPVHRGKWILETILGAPPPPPPPDVDNVLEEGKEEGKKTLTVPQRLLEHRSNPACVGCHRMIDPLGLALENFDETGKWRDKDQGQPIDARGTLLDGRKFDGVEELKSLLVSRKEDFVRCFVEQMLAYALGRKLEPYDTRTVKKIVKAVIQDDCKFSRVVLEVARSYPFTHRRVKEVDH